MHMNIHQNVLRCTSYCFMGGSREGGTWGRDPPEKSQNIGFLSKTGLDPLGNHKTTKPALNFWPYRPTSETPFKWRFAGRPMIACLKWY